MFRRSFVCGLLAAPLAAEDIWSLARERRQDHVFSTLFEAETVTKMLASDADIDRAMDWCRKSAVTRVFIESFRNGFSNMPKSDSWPLALPSPVASRRWVLDAAARDGN